MSATPRIPNNELFKPMRPGYVKPLPCVLIKNINSVTFYADAIVWAGFGPELEFGFSLIATHGNHIESLQLSRVIAQWIVVPSGAQGSSILSDSRSSRLSSSSISMYSLS
jgi:hypothetical protein